MTTYEQLKAKFSTSKKYEGYDADEDRAYFVEWLVSEFNKLEQKAEEWERMACQEAEDE